VTEGLAVFADEPAGFVGGDVQQRCSIERELFDFGLQAEAVEDSLEDFTRVGGSDCGGRCGGGLCFHYLFLSLGRSDACGATATPVYALGYVNCIRV